LHQSTKWVQRKPAQDYLPWDSIQDKLAAIRGVQLDEWLRPSFLSLHNPTELDNIEKVADRILKAIRDNEKIVVSFDPDTDGICSAVMLIRYLNMFTDNIKYTYHQRSEGHGISNQNVPSGTELLIICDSSTNEADECKRLKESGLDITILDHHLQERENPYALIVNPQICDYPNKELSGSGVVWKLLQIMDNYLGYYNNQFIDLAGIGLYADVMSMGVQENRYLVFNALKNISNPAIKALLKELRVSSINSQTIGYQIAPIVNASARLGQIEKVIEALLTDDPVVINSSAKELIKLNEHRKKLEAEVFDSIKPKILSFSKIAVFVGDEIPKGFNGLIATKICNHFGTVSLVLTKHDNYLNGSGRSIGDIKFKSIIQESGLAKFVLGHEGAFGISIHERKFEKLLDYLEQNIEYKEQQILYDLELSLDEISYDFIKDVNEFDYLAGKNAETCKFLIRNVPVWEVKYIGQGDTLKITSNDIDLLKFRMNEKIALTKGDQIDVIGSLNINKYYNFGLKRNIITKQMFIEDIRMC